MSQNFDPFAALRSVLAQSTPTSNTTNPDPSSHHLKAPLSSSEHPSSQPTPSVLAALEKLSLSDPKRTPGTSTSAPSTIGQKSQKAMPNPLAHNPIQPQQQLPLSAGPNQKSNPYFKLPFFNSGSDGSGSVGQLSGPSGPLGLAATEPLLSATTRERPNPIPNNQDEDDEDRDDSESISSFMTSALSHTNPVTVPAQALAKAVFPNNAAKIAQPNVALLPSKSPMVQLGGYQSLAGKAPIVVTNPPVTDRPNTMAVPSKMGPAPPLAIAPPTPTPQPSLPTPSMMSAPSALTPLMQASTMTGNASTVVSMPGEDGKPQYFLLMAQPLPMMGASPDQPLALTSATTAALTTGMGLHTTPSASSSALSVSVGGPPQPPQQPPAPSSLQLQPSATQPRPDKGKEKEDKLAGIKGSGQIIRTLASFDRTMMPESLKDILPPCPKAIPPYVFDCVMCILLSQPHVRASFGLGWQVLHHLWSLSESDFDAASLHTLRTKSPKEQEATLLLMASLNLTDIVNISAFLISLIKQHDKRRHVCMHFLLGLCDDLQCSCVHPVNTPGWDLLRDRWNLTYMDLDYAVLGNLAKRSDEERETMLKLLAAMSLRSIDNMSAFVLNAIRKHDAAVKGTSKSRPS